MIISNYQILVTWINWTGKTTIVEKLKQWLICNWYKVIVYETWELLRTMMKDLQIENPIQEQRNMMRGSLRQQRLALATDIVITNAHIFSLDNISWNLIQVMDEETLSDFDQIIYLKSNYETVLDRVKTDVRKRKVLEYVEQNHDNWKIMNDAYDNKLSRFIKRPFVFENTGSILEIDEFVESYCKTFWWK